MKIGIYCGNTIPEDGGAASLIGTIIDELKYLQTKHKIVLLYCDHKEKTKVIKKNGFKCINMAKVLTLPQECVLRILKMCLLDYSKYAKYDLIAKREKLDMIWFAEPVDGDISIPYIYTVWDLGHRTVPFFPEVSQNGEWQRREKKYTKMIAGASYILTGNETGKKEIMTNYCVDEKKIVINPFPVSKFCDGEERKPVCVNEDNYFFYPAQFWAHKNHIRILEAIKLLKMEGIEIIVYFTGTDKGNRPYIEQKIKEMDIEKNVVLTGFLTYEEIKYMYTHAQAMIFASLMGPNNMPPIEAVYLGCKVIITDIEGHKEQMGEAALYFDGYDSRSLASVIKKVYNSEYDISKIDFEMKKLAKQYKEVNYTKNVMKIISSFEKKRKCWK